MLRSASPAGQVLELHYTNQANHPTHLVRTRSLLPGCMHRTLKPYMLAFVAGSSLPRS